MPFKCDINNCEQSFKSNFGNLNSTSKEDSLEYQTDLNVMKIIATNVSSLQYELKRT